MDILTKLLLFAMVTILLPTAPIAGNGYPYPPPTVLDGMPPQPYFQFEDPLLAQFWDVYNYRGPLEQEPIPNGFLQPEDFYFQTRYPQIDDEAYRRYRDYFYRRYGTNFMD
ncbi:uncharacterized protein NPIL_309781 [Nephila pilipes]|uniref:Uncharacterized protein n=1 Tax=Nephila pilipes TaxID=299642 RepID=A0A8X6UJR0_NEPPI|nr:uncharacterized protein NPIL_309781 [Nephila pilipes]